MTPDSPLQRLVGRLAASELPGPSESVELEFKEARTTFPRRALESICAMANTKGGFVLLGVTDRGDVIGVDDPSDMLKQVFDALANRQRISSAVCGTNDVEAVDLAPEQVVVIRVPAASRRERPVYVNNNPYDGTFVRRHSANYKCSKPDVDRMMREAAEDSTDQTALRGFSAADDINPETLKRYRALIRGLSPTSPWLAKSDEDFLYSVGAATRGGDLTVAGLLVLGRDESIIRWRGKHLIDYREISGPTVDWADRVAWEGNLLDAFYQIYPRLVAQLPSPFVLRGEARVEGEAHVALREALVNLLVHADYTEQGSSLVVRAPQEFSFRNPGSSRIAHVDLFSADRSDPRNPSIMRMFRLAGLSEEAGTGLPRIAAAWRQLGLKLPKIDVGTERYEFQITLSHVHLLSEEDHRWLGGLAADLSNEERLALATARRGGRVDNVTLREMTGAHPTDTTRLLGGLRDRGLLVMRGKGKGAWYELPEAEPTDQFLLPLSEGSNPDIEHTTLMAELGGDYEQLWDLAAPVRGEPRVPQAQLSEVILEACRVCPLSIRQLAGLVGRDEAYMTRPVRELAKAGQLTYLFPDAPRRPGQKYVLPDWLYPGDRVQVHQSRSRGEVTEVRWSRGREARAVIQLDREGPHVPYTIQSFRLSDLVLLRRPGVNTHGRPATD